MTLKIDLNCDMGEGFGCYKIGNDKLMMQYITSANIACGYHAGDPHVMRETVAMAKDYGVSIGAHPGLPDLLGFGRRKMELSPSEVKDYIVYQLGALREFVSLTGEKIQHLKPHGQLYMMAMSDPILAKAILETVAEIDPEMLVFALENSEVSNLGRSMGIRVVNEAYADCEHTKSGSIIPIRYHGEARDAEESGRRIIKMIRENKVVTNTGEEVNIHPQTICVHGDTEGAPQLVEKIHNMLIENGIDVIPARDII